MGPDTVYFWLTSIQPD